MKILEITFDLASGGAERFAVDLSNELSKTNEVTLLTIKDDKKEPQRTQFYKFDLSDRVTYKNLGLPNGYSPKMVWQVYKAIKDEKADVVHLHGHGMPLYCVMAIYLLNRKAKFYQTIHSDIHNGYTSLFYQFLVKTVGYRKRMGFVAISESNYRDMMAEYPKVKGAYILNGRANITPTELYNDVKMEIESFKNNDTTRIYLHVARCNLVKNQLMLVRAFSKFVELGRDACLVIIGEGYDSELGASIKNNCGSNVHIIGVRKNVGDYMLNADVFCLSSTHEGMPITILEACLAGIPVVATPVRGATDVVKNGINGIISEGYSEAEYVDALERSFDSLQSLQTEAYKSKGNGQFTIETCAKKYLNFFSN